MKIIPFFRAIVASLVLCFGIMPAVADDAAPEVIKLGSLEISGGFVRATLPGARAGSGYLTITNKGAVADKLLSVTSPNAKTSQLHSMTMAGDVSKMRAIVAGIEIPAGKTVELMPSGLHIMFTGLTGPFVKGGSVPITLQFEKAGKVDLTLPVEAAGANSAMPGMAM